MNLMRIPLLLVFLFVPILSFAQPSGCVVEEGKIKKLDPSCNCLKTKKCYQGKKIKDDPKFFASIKGKSWIKYEEKELLKKSHILHNQLTSFKAQGLVQTREAREKYIQLREVTEKLEVMQRVQREKYLKRIADKNKELGIKKNTTDKGYLDRVLSFIATPFERLSAKTTGSAVINRKSIASQPSSIFKGNEKSPSVSTKSAQAVATISNEEVGLTPTSITDFEKKAILEKLKEEKVSSPEKITPNDDDSLFTKISKAYLRVAYDLLLDPVEE